MTLEIRNLITEFSSKRDLGKEEAFRDVHDHVGFRRSDRICQPQSRDFTVSASDFEDARRTVCISDPGKHDPGVTIENPADRPAVEFPETLRIGLWVVVHLLQSRD